MLARSHHEASLWRHSLAYLAARGVPGLINLAAIAVYTRLLTPDAYGRYVLVLATITIANVALFQWLRLSALRFWPSYGPANLLPTVIAAFAGIALLSGACVAVFAYAWMGKPWRTFAYIAVPLLWVQAWFDLNQELARIRLRPSEYGAMSGIRSVVALCVGSGAIAFGLGPYGPLLGLLVGSMCVASWGYRFTWRLATGKPSAPLARELARYGTPLAIAGLLAIVAAQCDRLVIAALLGDDAIGRYAAGYDLAHQTLTTAFMIVNLAATPLAIHAFDSGGLASARKQLAANGKVLLMVTIPVAVALLQFRELLVTFLIGAQFHEAALSIFPWIVVSAFLQGLKLYYLDSVFYLLKNTRALVVSFAPAVLLNVWLNFLLVPSYGIRGSAYAALLSNAVSLALGAVLILFILRRHHRMALR